MKGTCSECGRTYKFEEGLFSDISAFKCLCGGSFTKDETPRKGGRRRGLTLEEARTALQAGLRKGVACPCCGQFAKIYKRKLNSSMARTLITFYRRAQSKPGWVHVLREFIFEKSGLLYICGDYSKLIYWGLIEERGDKREDGNPSSGFFRITQRGIDFVEGRLRVDRHVYLYNDHQVQLDEGREDTNIREALGDKFDYEELMRA